MGFSLIKKEKKMKDKELRSKVSYLEIYIDDIKRNFKEDYLIQSEVVRRMSRKIELLEKHLCLIYEEKPTDSEFPRYIKKGK